MLAGVPVIPNTTCIMLLTLVTSWTNVLDYSFNLTILRTITTEVELLSQSDNLTLRLAPDIFFMLR